MAQTWHTDELLAAIRDDARLDDDDPSATNAILLAEATRCLHSLYVPAVRMARSDYYLTEADLPIVEGQRSYPIPHQAATASVRRIRLVDNNTRDERALQPLPFEDAPVKATFRSGDPRYYTIYDDRIDLYPTPDSTRYSLRIAFEYRPSTLIDKEIEDGYGVVIGMGYDASTEEFHISGGSSIFQTIFDDTGFYPALDVVCHRPPFATVIMNAYYEFSAGGFGFDSFTLTDWIGSKDRPLADVADNQTIIDGALERRYLFGVSAGDLLHLTGETIIPQIPPELHPVLAKHTAADFLRPIDPESADRLQLTADEQIKRILRVMSPRKQGIQQKMKPKYSNLRGRHGYRRGTFDDLI